MLIRSKLCWNCYTITWGELKASWLILPCCFVFEKWASSVDQASSFHAIIQLSLLMIKINKITNFRMWKSSMKNKMAKNTCNHVAEAGTDSNTKFQWWNYLVQDLRKALSNFKKAIKLFFFVLCFNFLNRLYFFRITSFLLIFSDIDRR